MKIIKVDFNRKETTSTTNIYNTKVLKFKKRKTYLDCLNSQEREKIEKTSLMFENMKRSLNKINNLLEGKKC